MSKLLCVKYDFKKYMLVSVLLPVIPNLLRFVFLLPVNLVVIFNIFLISVVFYNKYKNYCCNKIHFAKTMSIVFLFFILCDISAYFIFNSNVMNIIEINFDIANNLKHSVFARALNLLIIWLTSDIKRRCNL